MVMLYNFSVPKWKILFPSLMVLHLRRLGSRRSVSIIKEWGKKPFEYLHFFFRWPSWQESVQCFTFAINKHKKRLKFSAFMEQDWCCEGTHDNILNRHGASWTKGPKIIYGACVNLKGLWNSWTFPWHVLEKCNTLRKSTWIYEWRLDNLSFCGVSSTKIVHVKGILCTTSHLMHWI